MVTNLVTNFKKKKECMDDSLVVMLYCVVRYITIVDICTVMSYNDTLLSPLEANYTSVSLKSARRGGSTWILDIARTPSHRRLLFP